LNFEAGPEVDLEYIAQALENSARLIFETNTPYKKLGPDWQSREIPLEYLETKAALAIFLGFVSDLYKSNVLPSEIERGSRYLRIRANHLAALLNQGDSFNAPRQVQKAEVLANLVQANIDDNKYAFSSSQETLAENSRIIDLAQKVAAQLEDEFQANSNQAVHKDLRLAQNFMQMFIGITLISVYKKVGFTSIYALSSLICSKSLTNWYISND
jgi:hypothetical protein